MTGYGLAISFLALFLSFLNIYLTNRKNKKLIAAHKKLAITRYRLVIATLALEKIVDLKSREHAHSSSNTEHQCIMRIVNNALMEIKRTF